MKIAVCVAFLLLTSWPVACSSSRGTTIEIQNRSTTEITDIRLAGSGFSCEIQRIESGADFSTSVHPKGESGIAVSFRANGKMHEYQEQGYFEAGYKVRVDIGKDLGITVDSSI